MLKFIFCLDNMHKRKFNDENEDPNDCEDNKSVSSSVGKKKKIMVATNNNSCEPKGSLFEATDTDTRNELSESENDLESSCYSIETVDDHSGLSELDAQQHEQELQLFYELIKETRTSGEDSIGGEAPELPFLPGLFVQNYGDVALPLDEMNGERLIKTCFQTTSSVDSDSDSESRNAFQIEPSAIKINNPNWNSCLIKLVDRVAEGLGCKRKVEAKLDKLLVYKEKGHFKNQFDIEKDEPNAFAILIIQLPSKYESGELVINNKDGSKTTYDFGQSTGQAPYIMHFVAHYEDIDYEGVEVRSGYRLALVYSLCWIDIVENDIITKNRDSVDKMTVCLSRLIRNSKRKIGIILDHRYTPESLRATGIRALKGADSDRYNLLRIANSKLPANNQLTFYIVHSSLVIIQSDYNMGCLFGENKSYEDSGSFGDQESGGEEMDRHTYVDEWYDINGVPFLSKEDRTGDITLEEFDILINPNGESKVVTDVTHDKFWSGKRHCQMDNEDGLEAVTTTYSKYLLVFWPKKNKFDSMLKINQKSTLEYLYTARDSNFNNSEYLSKFEAAIKGWKCSRGMNYDGDKKQMIGKVLAIFEKVFNLELIKMFLKQIDRFEPAQLANIIYIYKWDSLKDSLHELLKPTSKNISNNCALVKVSRVVVL